MSDAIVVAVLSLVGTLLGSIFGILAANKLTNYRIEQLEKKVEKHNSVVERMYRLEERESALEKLVENGEEKIAKLESYHEHP